MTDQRDSAEITETPAILTETARDDAHAPPPSFNVVVLIGVALVLLCPVAFAVFGGKSFVALLCVALAVVGAVVCGLGWGAVTRSDGRQRGARLAAGGMLLAMACVAILFLIGQARGAIARGNCLTNQLEINYALLMYAQDYGHFPKDWAATRAYADTALTKSGPEKWVCPARNWLDPRPACRGYGMNAALAGRKPDDFSTPATLILTSDANSADGMIRTVADLDRTRHGGSMVITYVDGGARYVSRREAVRLAP